MRLHALALALLLVVSASLAPSSLAAELSTTGTVSPERVVPGGQVLLNAVFNSAIPLDRANVSLEIHDSTGARIFQKVFPAQTLNPGEDAAYSARWAVPSDLAPGSYSLQVGAFSTDWSVSYGWNESAGVITVATSFVGIPSATYYVDCLLGNDSNSGLTMDLAWSSIARANEAALQPGDFLRLRRDCSWTGPLTASWNGAEGRPITIEGYGTGNLPKIENGEFSQVSVLGSYLVFDGLNVRSDPALIDTSCNNNRVGYRLGFWFGPGSNNNTVKNSRIEDTGAGVDIGPGSFGNTITQNEFLNNNMMWDVDPWFNDGGANGVLIEGDSNDVSYNHISGSIVCSLRYPADGSAFELVGATNNHIHHNKVNGNWIFAELSQSSGNAFAYNLSLDGGFTNHTDATGTRLYNNVWFVPGGGVVSCFPCQQGDLTMVNNIIVADTALYAQGTVAEHNNLFWRQTSAGAPVTSLTRDPSSIVADPQFVDAANGDFHLKPTSPALNAGSSESVQMGWQQDMDGNNVPVGGAVDIGIYERR